MVFYKIFGVLYKTFSSYDYDIIIINYSSAVPHVIYSIVISIMYP